MNSEDSFEETQHFRQTWLWAFFVLLLFWLGSGALDAWYRYGGSGDLEMLYSRIFALLMLLLVMVLFRITRLQTHFSPDGIRLRFYPFHLGWVHYPLSEISSAATGTYSPIGDFLGWGVRYGRSGFKAYTTNGNACIRIVMKDGRKRLLGTQHPKRLQKWCEQHQLKGL
jgi:hypothetical protein